MHRNQQARWAKSNPDKVRAYVRSWAERNRGYQTEVSRDRYAADPEYFRERSRAYYAANRERILAARREKSGASVASGTASGKL